MILIGIVSSIGMLIAILLLLRGPLPIPDSTKAFFMGVAAFAQIGIFSTLSWQRYALAHEKPDWRTLLTENLAVIFFGMSAIFLCISMIVPFFWLFALVALAIGTVHAVIQMRALHHDITVIIAEAETRTAAPMNAPPAPNETPEQ